MAKNRNKNSDHLSTESDETKTVETTTTEETPETITETEEAEKEAPAPDEVVEEKPEDETKTVETEAVNEPIKPKKEWKWSFKPGDSVSVWGTGHDVNMKKGKKFNTTGAMAAILVEKGSASLEEIKPDELTTD
jgi:hypothetical protein